MVFSVVVPLDSIQAEKRSGFFCFVCFWFLFIYVPGTFLNHLI